MTERGIMSPLKVNAINPLLQYYQTSAKLIYRSGELALEKRKPTQSLLELLEEEPPYIISVKSISTTKKMP
jgi:hypothetical protein